MKKKLLLLGAALAVSAISAQVAFADNADNKQAPKKELTLEAVPFKPDLSQIKIISPDEMKSVGKVTVTYSGTTSAPTLDIESAGVVDPAAVKGLKYGELKAVGKVTGAFSGTTSATASGK